VKKYNVKKGDRVIVITGKNKGKIGKIQSIITESDRVLVEGVNQVVCFNKKEKTGMSTKILPIHISNVAHVTANNIPTRVRRVMQNGARHLIAVKTEAMIR
jgi:large subunit ribosomal protein L24